MKKRYKMGGEKQVKLPVQLYMNERTAQFRRWCFDNQDEQQFTQYPKRIKSMWKFSVKVSNNDGADSDVSFH